ncbi:MAG TPA: hypothetical protein VGD62_11120 [Acidobacteriaceae bacterium]
MNDALLYLLVGAMIPCLAALVANRLGWIQISLPDGPETPRVARASTARLTCAIVAEERLDAALLFKSPVRLFATIANDSAVAARALRGQWKVITPDNPRNRPMPIRREVLGPGDEFLDSCLVNESEDWETNGIRFDAEIEFDYLTSGSEEPYRERVRYRYDQVSQKMVRLAAR